MGITVRYRGRFADLDRVENFEERVLDLVLDLNGTAEIRRSTAETDSSRIVRGAICNLRSLVSKPITTAITSCFANSWPTSRKNSSTCAIATRVKTSNNCGNPASTSN